MNDLDHYALIESVLDDKTVSLETHERQALEQELADYYQCLAELGEFDLDIAMEQYHAHENSHAQTEFEHNEVYKNDTSAYPTGYAEHCLDLKYSY